MSKVKITGTLIEKSEPQTFSEKFTKCEIVVEVNAGKYPDYIKLEAVNNDIQALEGIRTLDEVEVEGFLSGRKYIDKKTNETKYMTSVRLRSIRKLSDNSSPSFAEEEFQF